MSSSRTLHPCESIIGPLSDFLQSALDKCAELGIGVTDKEIDHVCYRCESVDEYVSVCQSLKTMGECLIESMIGGRPISIIHLKDPILYKQYSISCVEVPCPKKGRFYARGLEHIEFAICSSSSKTPSSTTLQEQEKIVADIHDSKKIIEFAKMHPHVIFDMRAVEKDVNADISISINDKAQIKFHNRSIREVCIYEKSSGTSVGVPASYFTENL